MRLVLDGGPVLLGRRFGAAASVRGEVVFSTAMSGYVEALTDPSYRGQILVLTYPLIGNYGVPRSGLESPAITVQGLVVAHPCEHPSHHESLRGLSDWLASEGVPGLCGVDTRSLAQHLREQGTPLGSLLCESEPAARAVDMERVLELVAPPVITRYAGGSPRLLLIDTGAKEGIVRALREAGAEVIRAGAFCDWEALLPAVDGVVLGSGPGDPGAAAARELLPRLRRLLDEGDGASALPVFGVCLGLQLLALAAGGRTERLLFGHRSINQPVRDLQTGRCYLTSQNHGYAVDASALPPGFHPWFQNLHDGTCEGIRHERRPLSAVQFHPEGAPGPTDTRFLYADFVRGVRDRKGRPRTPEAESLVRSLPLREVLP